MNKTLQKQCPVLRVAVVAISIVIAGCADRTPLAPTLESPVRRNSSYICVRPGINGLPSDTLPPHFSEGCPAGYDNIPWY